jgi:beta-phosphoglucomutase
MKWIDEFDLFLFDFDGLLVNTEPLHYEALKRLCRTKNLELNWTFDQYCYEVHLGSENLKRAVYDTFPTLLQTEPNWSVFYEGKKKFYMDLLKSSSLNLMNGVDRVLDQIKNKKKKSCIVTNSPKEQIEFIRSKIPQLRAIEHIVSREQYKTPKPSSECYLRAIELYGEMGDKIIGFEDSMKGLKALEDSPLMSVLICPSIHPQMTHFMEGKSLHFESFDEISLDKLS